MVRPTQPPSTPNPLAAATAATRQQSPESSGISISAAPGFALPVQEGEDPDANLPQAQHGGDPALLFRELFDETVMKGATASDDGHIAAAAKEQELISATLERVWNLQEGEGPGDTLPQGNEGGRS